MGMDADANGNVYAEYTIDWAGGTIDTQTVTQGVYLAKYDADGNFIWAKKKFNRNSLSLGYDAYYTVIRGMGDKIFGIGHSSLDTLAVDTITMIANYQYPADQGIISCFDANTGTAIWTKPCAGPTNLVGFYNINIDKDKNSYITGPFDQTNIFGNDTLTYSAGMANAFLAKYDSSGNAIWAQQINVESNDVAIGNDTSVYITGYFSGTVYFGNFSVTGPVDNMFVARYDGSGNCIGVRHVEGANGMGVAVDNNDNVYCSGMFAPVIQFDSNPVMTSYGQADVYFAKSTAIIGGITTSNKTNNQLIIYANPNQGTCNVIIPDEFLNNKRLSLNIYDNAGKVIQTVPVDISDKKVRINLEQEAKGVYPVTLTNGHKTYSGKIVFE